MLDKIDLHNNSVKEICIYLKKSCCPALKELIKEIQNNFNNIDRNERTQG